MKRLDLIRTVEEDGAAFVRHGHGHDWYRNVITGNMAAIPRHREINEYTARSIIKDLASPDPNPEA